MDFFTVIGIKHTFFLLHTYRPLIGLLYHIEFYMSILIAETLTTQLLISYKVRTQRTVVISCHGTALEPVPDVNFGCAKRTTEDGGPYGVDLRVAAVPLAGCRGTAHRPCPTGLVLFVRTRILTQNNNIRQRKNANPKWIRVFVCVGIFLSSRAASSQVLSAQVSLTSVFGMGTGVPSPPSTPTIQMYRLSAEYPEN